MNFGQTELERAIEPQLSRFLADHYDFQARHNRLSGGAWKNDLWLRFASDLGILGTAFPQDVGGLGGGSAEVGAIMQSFGKHLVVEPFLTTVVMGGGALQEWNNPEATALLDGICSGNITLAFAHTESDASYGSSHVACRAEPSGDDFVLNGSKILVLNAASADFVIIVARTSGDVSDQNGVSLFLVNSSTAGMTRSDYRTIDGGSASNLHLAGVVVSHAAVVGRLNEGWPILERLLDEATAAVCAEACGVMQAMLDMTVEYTRQRKQFGRAIAEFQVLQHRMVDMLIDVKQAASLTLVARLKMATPDRSVAVSAAKSRVGKACRAVSQAAIQLHGGIGIADETPISHYFRRALMIEQQFGSVEFHLGRYERLSLCKSTSSDTGT